MQAPRRRRRQQPAREENLTRGVAESFYVDHGNGLRSYFGETSNSRVAGAAGQTRTWFISSTVDQFGNAIEYGYYSPSTAETLPQTIAWTSNDTESLEPRYAVTITYEDRPPDDVRSGYDSGGGGWWRTKRIDAIDVTYDDGTSVQDIATYALTYAATLPPNGTGRSQLTGVSVCRGAECLPETLFTVQNGTSGWGFSAGTTHAIGNHPLAGDWNGDGRMDLFVSLGNEWWIYPGNVLFDTAVDTNIASTTNPAQARVFDFDGDGLADLLYQDGSSNWKVRKSTGSTSSPLGSAIDTGVPTSAVANPMLQDHDGDGLADLVYQTGGGIHWRRNQGGSFAPAGNLYAAEASVPTFGVGTVDSALRSLDANGDGRADLIAEIEDCVYNPNNPEQFYCENKYYLLLTSGGGYNAIHFSTLPTGLHHTNFRTGDFNGDGLGDFLYLNQYLGTKWQLQFGTGVGTAGQSLTVPVTNAAKVLIADYDGDGRDDLIRPDGDTLYIHRWNGTTIPATATASLSSPGIGSAAAFVADIGGSGYPQIVRTQGSVWAVHLHKSALADVVTDFTDGLGRTVSVEYESLAQTDAYTLNLAHAPTESRVQRYGGARFVVTAETHDDGIGATRDFLHTYDTAFVNAAGRGWQAFRKHTVTDALQGTYSVTNYSQAFPTAGMVELSELKTLGADGVIGTSDDRLIRSVDPVPAASAISGTTPPRQFVRVEETSTVEKEVGGASDGQTLRTILENPSYDSTYGHVTTQVRTVTQPGVSGSWSSTTTFNRTQFTGEDEWCLGLPGLVETASSIPGGSPPGESRSVRYQFNSADCSLDTVTDESDTDTAKQLRRKFEYDPFGNVESVKEYSVAAGPTQARTTSIDFDADGQFPETVTVGGVNLTTALEFDPRLGVKTAVTGPDQLTTSYLYDAFGRLKKETRPAGFTDLSYHVCASGGCFAPRAALYVRAADSTGATSYTFLDAFERPVGSDVPLAGGKRSREQIRYLDNGRLEKRSLPYVAGESVHWVTMTYDPLGRTLTEADGTGTTATYQYLGHTLEIKDGQNHTTQYLHNALGQIKEVVDAMGGSTDYTYRPFGELYTVKDHANHTTTIEYDARGFKTHLYDPDMGHWQYAHNAFGELVWQKDAKNQEVTLAYDAAGRLATRSEPEGTTSFTFYPHNASAGRAGRLQTVTSPGGLSEAFQYHATHGAVTEITRSIGAASYELDFAYDTQGRLTQLTYPQNVHAQRLGVEYLYDGWGALSQVRNAATPSTVYFTLNEQDGSGATRRATFGNGLVEQYGYQPTTGRLASIKTGPNGSATLQNLAYEWDLAGNLKKRVDQLLTRTEDFNYDALDRLTGVVRNSSTVFSAGYDALGNITSKTGVSGTFTYGGSRPHAVTAVGSMTFAYDANGNTTNRNGDDIDWTSYNLPSRIEAPGGEYSTFLYGHDRSRYVQTEVAGSLTRTRHYASPGLFEVTWDNGAARMDYHYIHANGRAVAQLTTSSGGDVLQYLHRDHQGSVVATTNTGGALLDRFEYDPFGQRTTTVGSDELSPRGYTGHEHLVAPDLIHMNGRVQDPLLGRFLSPDPLVSAPYYSQSLNRYSYVWNNPLSLVDPSGFDPRKCENGEGETTGGYLCGNPCLFNFSCQGLDFQNQLWIAETFGVEQRDPAFIFNPPVQFAQPVPAAIQPAIDQIHIAPQAASSGLAEIVPGSAGGHYRSLGTKFADYMGNRLAQIQDDWEYMQYLQLAGMEGDAEAMRELDEMMLNSIGPGGITKVVGGRLSSRVLGRGLTAGMRVNMPAWKTIAIDMEEVISGHMLGGSRLAPGTTKDLFPAGMTTKQVARAIRSAYRNGEVLNAQGSDRVFVRGPFGSGTIEMWVNKVNKTIETAWPKF